MPQRRFAALILAPLLLALLAGCGGTAATASGALRPAATAAVTPTAVAASIPAASARPTTVAGASTSPAPRATVGGAVPTIPPGLAATATAVAALPIPSSLPGASAAPTGPPAKIGQQVTVGGSAITLVSVQDNAPSGALPPAAGDRRYVLDLIVENVGTDLILYSALFGSIILADGTEVSITFDTEPTPQFSGGQLAPSENARGWLTFDLPKAATPAQFVYDNLDVKVIYALK